MKFLAYSTLPLAFFYVTAAAQSTTSFEYDANGNQTRVTDAMNRSTDKQYDLYDRLVRAQLPPPTTGADAPALNYIYDGRDQLTGVTDPRNLHTSYIVDGLGNHTLQNSPDTLLSSRTFDAHGNLTSSKDARGFLTRYSYDAGNRLTSIVYASGTSTTFEYGANLTGAAGRLIRITDESGETNYDYDATGRLLNKTQIVAQNAGSRQFQMHYGYGQSGSALGKVDRVTYPSGRRLQFEYGLDGQVSRVQVALPGTATQVVLMDDIRYSPLGIVESWLWGGRRYQREFDLQGRLIRFPLGDSLNGGLVRTLNYDNAGNLIAAIHDSAILSPFDQSYTYDALGRLKTFSAGGINQAYQYDLSGNRTALTLGNRTFANRIDPTSNRLLNSDGPLPAKNYNYDASGNFIGAGDIQYSYSARGRLQAMRNGTVVAQYLYNGLDERILKMGTPTPRFSGTSYFTYDEAHQLVGEYDVAGGLVSEMVYLGDLPVAVIKDTGIYYVYADQINTPRVITDTTHRIVWRWDQADPFGMLPPNEIQAQKFIFNERFPGQHYDDGSNLNYNYYRDYDPQGGRYIQSDSIGLRGGINTYAYANSSPARYTDPHGLDVYVANTQQVFGMHQKIMVDTPNGPYGQSFGMNSGVPMQGPIDAYGVSPKPGQPGSGEVYVDPDPITKITRRFPTTGAEDALIAAYLRKQIGFTGPYNVGTNNCRDYSNGQYNYIVRWIRDLHGEKTPPFFLIPNF